MRASNAASGSTQTPAKEATARRSAKWQADARHNHSRLKSRREAIATRRASERDAVTVKLLSLVKRVAHEMREHLPAHVDVDDLMSAGTLGLIDAVRRFETSKHVKIETYARYRIRGAILDALRTLDPASRDMRKKNKRAERQFQELGVRLGRPATDSELADALHISLKEWYQSVHEMQSMGLEWMRPTLMGEDRPRSQEELPAENQPNQMELCYRREQRDLLNQALERVSERERQILSLYYEQDLTMKQIGDQLGIDESRVSQIHSAALNRLRSRVQTMLRPPAHVSHAA
ncbi:MAG TPA: FliA/WhiG family RNA polymerase sigma factor [Terriglobia bacterium]|nr:FliA/WhiG family RNA polymerase sigma factor [Terriglobia bacterium]